MAKPMNHNMREVLNHAGDPYKKIAEELNIPIGTVKSRLHRARAKEKLLMTVPYAGAEGVTSEGTS